MADALLLESGDYLLFEDGSSHLLLEQQSITAAGAIITVTPSVISGTASGGASTGGQTVDGGVTIISTPSSGGASAPGGVFEVPVSIISGVASGVVVATSPGGGSYGGGPFPKNAFVTGVKLNILVTLEPGVATVRVVAPGATMVLASKLQPGKASGSSVVSPMAFEIKTRIISGRAKGFDAFQHDQDLLLLVA